MVAPSSQPPPSPPRYEPMALCAAALAVGIGVDRFQPQAIVVWWSLAAAMLLAWGLLRWRRLDVAASCCVLAAAASTGGAWHHWCWNLVPGDHIVATIREQTQPICLEATVVSSPRIVPAPPFTPLRAMPMGDRSQSELAIVAVRDGEVWRPASGRARLSVDGHLLDVRSGDSVRVFALYHRPRPALNPGEFDFADFERSQRRWCNLSAESPACVQVKSAGSPRNPLRWLDSVRLQGNYQLRRYLSPERSAIAAAVMLGQREFLDADRNERFLVTGTVHLLAISGLHLGILVYVFWLCGRTGLLSRRTTLAAAIVFALFYALLTDARPPVLRAAVLITAFCLAQWSGRPASPWNVLGIAAIAVLAISPSSLFHAGAQLSFLAVAVLAFFRPLLQVGPPADPLDRLILQSRPWVWRFGRIVTLRVGQIVLAGTLIWIISLPLVWQHYNLVSPIAVGLNPLVWIPITIALFSGFGVLVLGWIAPLGGMLGWLCDTALWALETLITWCEPLQHGHYWLPAPPVWWVAAFYAGVALAAMFPALRPRRTWGVALLLSWAAIAQFLAMPSGPPPSQEQKLHVTFAAVGHGAAILVEFPDGRNLLYDCGRLGSPLSGARPIASVLWSRGITHRDAVVISHADSDHYNALPDLLDRFSVGVVYVSTVMWNERSGGLDTLRRSIEQHGVPLATLRSGDQLRVGDGETRMDVLHPPRGGVFGSDNANSIVLLIEHQGRRVLLTGDLEGRGLADLLAEPATDCDLLLAPHHGSTRSNPQGLAAWCRPEYVVISGDVDYELGRDGEAVARAFYAAGANVFHTSEHGAVRFEISADAIRVAPWRDPPQPREESIYFVATNASQ